MVGHLVAAALVLLFLSASYGLYRRHLLAKMRPRSDGVCPIGPTGKILILTAAVGGGHEAAGRTVRTELERAGHSVVMADGLRQMSRVLDWMLVRFYSSQVRNTPRSLGAVFAATSRKSGAAAVRFLVGLLFADRLLEVIERERPDLVVSTYPLVTAALGRLRKVGRLRIPAAAIIPDYGAHPLWVDPWVDQHLVVSRHSAELAKRAGGKVSLARLPVPDGFHSAPTRDDARAILGLPRKAFVALVVGGAWGIGDLEGAARCAAESGALTVVVTGTNAGLKARLEERFASEENVWILGWRDDIPVLMAAADCLIQNAGGMTCLEAIEMGLPILIFDPIRGHGEFNAQVMERAGSARWVHTAGELTTLLRSAARGETSLALPHTEPGVPPVCVRLEALVDTYAPQPEPGRRVLRPRWVLVGCGALVLSSWLSFASPGFALAAGVLHLRVPGYKPPANQVALGIKVTDPTTASALENSAPRERVPVTIFTDARGAEGLRPSPGLAFGVAEEPEDGRLPTPWKERSQARIAATEIQRVTGKYPEYFLPATRTDLATLADAPLHTRLVMPERTAGRSTGPGLLIVDASHLGPRAARSKFMQTVQAIHHEGLECVPLAQL
jgi:processive 1,2-diacylglycerol beta-glucosyltransferase